MSFGCGPREDKGEGDGFPQGEAVMNIVNLNLPMAHLNTKSASTMH